MMQLTRTNQDWILALSSKDERQESAIIELRGLLLRAALFTLVAHIHNLGDMDERDRVALAEDCAQMALQAVLDHLGEFRGDSLFTTWAYKFGVNIALTRAHRERWKKVSLEAISEEDDALEWLPVREAMRSPDSEKQSLRGEVGKLIHAVIREELTSRQRQVLKWIAFDDVPMDVVVERLDTNRNAVYKLLYDARLKVKRRLASHGYQVDEVYELFGPAG